MIRIERIVYDKFRLVYFDLSNKRGGPNKRQLWHFFHLCRWKNVEVGKLIRCAAHLLEKSEYSWMNRRQLHIIFNSAKTWHVIVCWFLCFAPNLPELSLKLFSTDVQNNFRLSSGKFRAKHRNQQTITCQVLAELKRIWSCLIFIRL